MGSLCHPIAEIHLQHNEEHKANARLIAAAPELLEALKEIAKGKGAYSHDHFEHAKNTIDNMKDIAKQAIAKAEEI